MATKRTPAGLVGRWLIVVIAFALAIALTLIVLTALGSVTMGEELRDGQQIEGELGTVITILSFLFGGASFLVALTPTLTVIPALIAVIIGEVVQIRSLLYYVIAGGLAVVSLPLLASPVEATFNTHYMAIFATAGFAGGFCYWLMAGRNS